MRNTVERAVYRWEKPDVPVGEVEFDPFASPWMPKSTKSAISSDAGQSIDVAVPPTSEASPPTGGLRASVTAYERSLVEAALSRHRYNQRAAAKALSLSYDQLRHAMKRLGLAEKAV